MPVADPQPVATAHDDPAPFRDPRPIETAPRDGTTFDVWIAPTPYSGGWRVRGVTADRLGRIWAGPRSGPLARFPSHWAPADAA